MTANDHHDQYNLLLTQSEACLQQRDYNMAQQLLRRAHSVGHAVKADHLKAHRALIRLGIHSRNPLQVFSQSALLVLAFIFD